MQSARSLDIVWQSKTAIDLQAFPADLQFPPPMSRGDIEHDQHQDFRGVIHGFLHLLPERQHHSADTDPG